MNSHLKKQYYVISALTIVIFGVLFFVSHSFLNNKLIQDRNQQLNDALNEFALSTVDKIQEATEQLRGYSSIVVFSKELSHENFEAYVRDYSVKSLKWEVIEWQPLIKSSEREAFEQHIKETEFAEFFVWEPDASGRPIPARKRDEHVIVLYMVAGSEVANTMGLDLAWSEDRLRSKLRARDEGGAQLSGFFPLILSPEDNRRPLGFAVTLPVYEDGTVPPQVQARRNKITGFMAAVYSVEKLVENELASLSEAGLNVSIETAMPPSLFSLHPQKKNDLANSPVFTQSVQLYGNTWVFSMNTVDEASLLQSTPILFVLPYGLIVFGVLILIFIRLLFNSNNKLVTTQSDLRAALEKVSRSEQFYADLSRQDPLTGLLNRRAFLETLLTETDRARRYQQPLSLMIVDIDNFKQVNDTHGHPSGDSVLVDFAKTITELSRSTDFICRFGGEEFAFILLNTDDDEGIVIAERLCHVIENHDISIPDNNDTIRITVSVGLARYVGDESAENLVLRADKALYKAKEAGRNRVSVAPTIID